MDVSQHELVPEHELLDDEEVEEVLAEYGIKRTDLPKIKYNPEKPREQDPALQALDEELEPGNVVKVTRDSRTTEEAVVYRLVVK